MIGAAIKVAKITTGEIEEDRGEPQSAAAELGRKGGKARAERMTPEQRAEAKRLARMRTLASKHGCSSREHIKCLIWRS